MSRVLLASALLLLLLSCLSQQRAHGLTIDEIGLTEARCAAIRANPQSVGFIPCACRLNTGFVQANRCFPNCCPKTETFEGDRCHVENKLSWSVYEQQVCLEQPPAEYTADTPNCFYRGNPPIIKSISHTATTSTINFELSIIDTHKCDNLFIAKCKKQRDGYQYRKADDFRLNTTDSPPKHCWLACPPEPLAPCTAQSCTWHRGETRSVIRSWTTEENLLPGDYALICYTLVQGDAVGSTLYQNAFASTCFKVD